MIDQCDKLSLISLPLSGFNGPYLKINKESTIGQDFGRELSVNADEKQAKKKNSSSA